MRERSFAVPGDSAVVTSTGVARDKMPILCVSHEIDEVDGSALWQFHCDSGDYDMEKMPLVSLASILALDASIVEVLDLPAGFVARRRSAGDRRIYSRE